MRVLAIIVCLCAGVSAQSQGIFHYYTGLILPDKNAAPKEDRLGFDVYHNSWLELPQGIKVQPYSIGVNVYRIYDLPFGHSPFGIGIGYGYSRTNFHHNGEFVESTNTTTGQGYSSLSPLDPNYNYRKNKTSLNYFEIPFELRMRSKKKKNKKGVMKGPFRFYPGFKVGYMFNIHSTTKDKEGKYKNYNYSALDRIRYGATFKIGFGKFSLFGFYSLTSMYQKDRGDMLQDYAIGISFLTF